VSDEEKGYLLRLFRWLLAWERRIWTILRPLYARAMLRIRAMVAALPDAPLTRQLQWRMQQSQVIQSFTAYNDAFLQELTDRLVELTPGTLDLAAEYLGVKPPTAPPASAAVVQQTTRVLQQSLLTLYTKTPGATASPFVRQHVKEINRVVEAGFLANTPSAELASEVVTTITIRGEVRPAERVGTVFNRLRARAEAIISAAVWNWAAKVEQLVWAPAAPQQWRWYSVLDPKTCPICAPLDGRTETDRNAFPYQPPVHPNCRCRILPFTPT
jgi:SPP1 gp7 family putative phage head morphogenesis protein